MGTLLDYRVPGKEQVGEPGDSSWPTPQILSQIHTLTLASRATSGPCLNLPDPLHFFARPPIPSSVSEERPRSSPDHGQGLPTFSGPVLPGGQFSRTGKKSASPSLNRVGGWGGEGRSTGLQSLFSGLTLGPPGPGPSPCSLLEQRKGGRVPAARPKLGRVPGGLE